MASYFNSLFGITAEPTASPVGPVSTDSTTAASGPKAPNVWDKYSKEELKQLGLMRRYLHEQEEHKRELLPGLTQDIWKLIGPPGSEMPPLFYPTGSANAAVERAFADPDAYLADIPSANKLIKALYSQVKAPSLLEETMSKQKQHQAQVLNQFTFEKAQNAGRVKASNRIGNQRGPAPRLLNPQAQAAAQAAAQKGAIVAAIKLRFKTRYADGGTWEYLGTEYAKRREAIYAVRRDGLFDLLLVAERNFKLVMGCLLELAALITVVEQTTALGVGNWSMIKAFGANKMAKHQLEKAFSGTDFSWPAVRSELGL